MTDNSYSPKGVEQIISDASSMLSSEHDASELIMVGGKSMTVGDLLSQLAEIQKLYGGVRDLHAQLHALLAEQKRRHKQVTAWLQVLRQAIVTNFVGDSHEIESYGFKLKKKPAPLTSAQLVAKATKQRETRRLLKTMGKRQKALIKATGTPSITIAYPEGWTVPPSKAGNVSVVPQRTGEVTASAPVTDLASVPAPATGPAPVADSVTAPAPGSGSGSGSGSEPAPT